jgi:hypothetical protein
MEGILQSLNYLEIRNSPSICKSCFWAQVSVINYEEGGEHSLDQGDTEGEALSFEQSIKKTPLIGERDIRILIYNKIDAQRWKRPLSMDPELGYGGC